MEVFKVFSQGQNSTALGGAVHVDIPVPSGRGRRGRSSRFSPRTGFISFFIKWIALTLVMELLMGFLLSASQCGDHPQGYFSTCGVIAHSSSWSPAAYGHGTLPGEDDGQGDFFQDGDEEEEEEELEMFDESIDRFELSGWRPRRLSAVTTWQAAVHAGGATRLLMVSKSFTRHPFLEHFVDRASAADHG